MIALASDCLLFKMASGESIPFSAEMISVELMGDTSQLFDSEFVRHAASAVFHYFKEELGRKTVTVGEFAGALEKVLRGFVLTSKAAAAQVLARVQEADLGLLASESGKGCDLFFFPRLRAELRERMRQGPEVVRFRGLRDCVMQLTGSRRWTPRCRSLEEQIVAYLRGCLSSENSPTRFAMVVE